MLEIYFVNDHQAKDQKQRYKIKKLLHKSIENMDWKHEQRTWDRGRTFYMYGGYVNE